MNQRGQVRLVLVAVIILAALAGGFVASTNTPSALAQDDGGGGFGGGGRRMGMGGMGGASMCAIGSNLYVLRGNTLTKFDSDLKVVSKYTFEDAPPGGGAPPPKKSAGDEGEGR